MNEEEVTAERNRIARTLELIGYDAETAERLAYDAVDETEEVETVDAV